MKKSDFIRFFASGFYSGYSPQVPGTTGTLPIWLAALLLFPGHQTIIISLAVILTLLSVYLAGEAEKIWGHDSKKIVIDEWAGMMITLILVPFTIPNYIIALMAFRVTDVLKIFPARSAESLPGGWGVTADDVVAGIQANILTRLTVYILFNYILTG